MCVAHQFHLMCRESGERGALRMSSCEYVYDDALTTMMAMMITTMPMTKCGGIRFGHDSCGHDTIENRVVVVVEWLWKICC